MKLTDERLNFIRELVKEKHLGSLEENLIDHIDVITAELFLCKEGMKQKDKYIKVLEQEVAKLCNEKKTDESILQFADKRINNLIGESQLNGKAPL